MFLRDLKRPNEDVSLRLLSVHFKWSQSAQHNYLSEHVLAPSSQKEDQGDASKQLTESEIDGLRAEAGRQPRASIHTQQLHSWCEQDPHRDDPCITSRPALCSRHFEVFRENLPCRRRAAVQRACAPSCRGDRFTTSGFTELTLWLWEENDETARAC
jgi:hypothetical protein